MYKRKAPSSLSNGGKTPVNLARRANKLSKTVYSYLFPLIEAESLADFASLNRFFEEYKTISSFLAALFGFMAFLTLIMSAFRLPFLVDFQILNPAVYGQFGYFFTLCTFFSSSEMTAIRIWLYSLARKHPSSDTIDFMRLINQLDEKSSRTIVRNGRMFSIFYAFVVYNFLILLFGNQCLMAGDILHFLIPLFHLVMFVQFCRINPNDVLILYIYIFAGCQVVLEQLAQLKRAVNQSGQFTQPMFFILEKYSMLITSINQLNSLIRPLIFLSELLVYPMGSMAVLVVTSPSIGLLSITLKLMALVGAIGFTLHGYLLVALLSRVDTASKQFYSDTNSVIARGRHHDPRNILRLRFILEDMSCSRSHLVVREFGGTVTQMDAYNSVTSTASILTLVFAMKEIQSHFI